MSRKQLHSNAQKLDQLLELTTAIHQTVEQQNAEISALRRELASLEDLVNKMSRKNRTQSLIAGGIGGGIAAVGFELIRWKFGG
ncbi:hypothetical protein QJU96_09610 [Pasteurella skyensis]|uniref:Uncharacterized protein n=1 Tax=Phocoenobacter skyensis TaxID=97481 RepID=A0AAJ6NEP2_9PAST|nr:hypothetical protein [Pasteurella skyensis]MDP8171536.1 hypothetical protein [Pasteurella skyensis]MDP8175438.1 hypothetical protein [Pasteurella skyensis]